MNAAAANERNKSTIHVQLLGHRHQNQVAQGEKTNTSVIKVHKLNRINGAASSAKQQEPTPKSVIKSAVTIGRINGEKYITNSDTSIGGVVQTPRPFENRVTDLNSSVKSAHVLVNNSSMMEVIKGPFHCSCV